MLSKQDWTNGEQVEGSRTKFNTGAGESISWGWSKCSQGDPEPRRTSNSEAIALRQGAG